MKGRKQTHGDARRGSVAPEYQCWRALKRRCLSVKDSRFSDYGGRGIMVCQRWLDSYANFLADMGRRPTPNHSLDRKDNDGNYEPGNCRWATKKEQSENRRNSLFVVIDTRRTSVVDAEKKLGIPAGSLKMRLWRLKLPAGVIPELVVSPTQKVGVLF